MRSRCTRWCFALFICSTGWISAFAAPNLASEYKVKAAFILNFTKFVSWPEERLINPDEPIVIGVLSENLVALELGKIVQDRRVNEHPLLVKHVTSASDAAGAHVLYVPSNERAHYEALRLPRDDKPLLVIADDEFCATIAATICFVNQEDRLRFRIDNEGAARSKLKISSHLLQLAMPATK
jgi:hypothetical protein